VQIGRESELAPVVPKPNTVSLICETTVSGNARPMTTDEIDIVNLRENLGPEDARKLIEE
jgi:hypothetical protein